MNLSNVSGRVSQVLLLISISLISGGCATKQTILVKDSFQFKGDVSPTVSSSAAIQDNFSALTEGETIVIGVAKDGSGVLSQPDVVSIRVIESFLKSEQFDRDLAIERCDTDNDGILDMFCSDLALASRNGQLGNEKIVALSSFYTISTAKDKRDQYFLNQVDVDIAKEDKENVEVFLKLFVINRGNAVFSGDLKIPLNVPPQLSFGQFVQGYKVRDARAAKSVMDVIPVIQFLTLAIDDYTEIEAGKASFNHEQSNGLEIFSGTDISLSPGEGVVLEFSVSYDLSFLR